MLTYPTANRLRERVELIDTLHASFKILKGDWSTFPLDRGVPQELPPWWKIGFHDKVCTKRINSSFSSPPEESGIHLIINLVLFCQALCRGVLKHGYGNWVKISEDPSLVFHTLIEPNSSSAEDKALRPCVVPEKFAIKRLKYVLQESAPKCPFVRYIYHNRIPLFLDTRQQAFELGAKKADAGHKEETRN